MDLSGTIVELTLDIHKLDQKALMSLFSECIVVDPTAVFTKLAAYTSVSGTEPEISGVTAFECSNGSLENG